MDGFKMPQHSTRSSLLKLGAKVGQRATRASRILYCVAGVPVDDRGAVEISFADGSVLLFDVCADGHELSITDLAWADPFTDPLSEENRQYIDEVGKWTRVPFGESGIGEFVGTTLMAADPTKDADGKLRSVQLRFDQHKIVVAADADEVTVESEARSARSGI